MVDELKLHLMQKFLSDDEMSIQDLHTLYSIVNKEKGELNARIEALHANLAVLEKEKLRPPLH